MLERDESKMLQTYTAPTRALNVPAAARTTQRFAEAPIALDERAFAEAAFPGEDAGGFSGFAA